MCWDFLFTSLSNFYELVYLKTDTFVLQMALCAYQSLHMQHFALYMYQEEQSRVASVFKDGTLQAAAKIFKLVSSVRSGIRKPEIVQIWASWSLQG